MTAMISDEEEKQEIEPADMVNPDDLTGIATNVESDEVNHDSNPDVTEEDASDLNAKKETPIDQDVASSKEKGWNKFTLALIFVVVALTAALVIVVPVLLTRDGNDSNAAASTEFNLEKQFAGDTTSGAAAADRQVPTSAAPFTASPVAPFTPSPSVPAPNKPQPVDTEADSPLSEEQPPSVTPRPPSSNFWNPAPISFRPDTSRPSSLNVWNPSSNTPRPSSWYYPTSPVYNYNQCYDANNDMDCDGLPCGLTTYGGDEVVCCSDWSTTEVWNQDSREYESYCWGSFALGADCLDDWNGDGMCQSGICHAGTCANQRGVVGEVCTDSRNCTNGCGLVGPTSGSASVCCENYETSFWDGSTYISYCAASFGLGASCIVSDQCETFICLQGQCALQRLPVGSMCNAYDECDNYSCGLASLPNRRSLQEVVTLIINGTNSSSTHNGTNSTHSICCPSGGTYSIYNGRDYQEYCSYIIPTGEQCIADNLCQSGICINETATRGVCRDTRLADGATCFSDNHCQNYGCGYSTFQPTNSDSKACCPNGRYEWLYQEPFYDQIKVCARSIPEGQPCDGQQNGGVLCQTGLCIQNVCSTTRLPIGDDCDGYDDCQSGQCGFTFNASDAKQVCCDQTLRIYDDIYYEYLNFCVGTVPTGESCGIGLDGNFDREQIGNDDNEKEIADGSDNDRADDDAANDDARRLQEDGVDTPVLCISGICVQGVCSDEYLEAGETCNRDSECSNAACAFSSFGFADRERVCCVGDALYYYEAPFYDGQSFCERSVASGGQCPSQTNNREAFRICESGICINSLCTDERQPDGDLCQNSNDCDSQACGFDSANFDTRKMICCSSEDTVYINDGFDYDYYCVRNVPLGGQCISSRINGRDDDYYGGSNGGLMCTSGICIDNVCVDSRLEDEAVCNKHGECDSGACGFNSLNFASREKVCCESVCSTQLFDGFSYENYCVGIQDEGEACTWDNGRDFDIYPQLCSTGICVDEICTTELLNYNDTCSRGTDCIGGSCGFTSFDMSADKVCCDRTYSIYDGICGHDEFCQGSFTFGQQCSYHGQRYDSLCDSYVCTTSGTCGNATMPCPEYEEEEGNGDEDSPPFTNSTSTNSTSGNGRPSNFTRRQLEDQPDTDDGGFERPDQEHKPCH